MALKLLIIETDMKADPMEHYPSPYETFKLQANERHNPGKANTAPELRIWLRRKLIVKVTLFFVCFVSVGLVLLLLNL